MMTRSSGSRTQKLPPRAGRCAVFRICAIPSLRVNLNQQPSPPSNREKRKEEGGGGRRQTEQGRRATITGSYPRRLTSGARTGRRVRQTVFARPDHLELINVGQGQAAACGRIKAPPRKLRGSNPLLSPPPLVGRGRTPISNRTM